MIIFLFLRASYINHYPLGTSEFWSFEACFSLSVPLRHKFCLFYVKLITRCMSGFVREQCTVLTHTVLLDHRTSPCHCAHDPSQAKLWYFVGTHEGRSSRVLSRLCNEWINKWVNVRCLSRFTTVIIFSRNEKRGSVDYGKINSKKLNLSSIWIKRTKCRFNSNWVWVLFFHFQVTVPKEKVANTRRLVPSGWIHISL